MAKTYTVEQYDANDLQRFIQAELKDVPVDITFKTRAADREAKRPDPVVSVYISPRKAPGVRYQIYKADIPVHQTFTKLDAQAALSKLMSKVELPAVAEPL